MTTNATTSHTPTPWHVVNGRKGSFGDESSMKPAIFIHGPPMFPNGNCPNLLTGFERTDPTEEERANAALIVRAVNAHDALVAALARLTGSMLLHEGRDIVGRDLGTWDAEALIHARAALKLARGDA
jgi:hypothetical protein